MPYHEDAVEMMADEIDDLKIDIKEWEGENKKLQKEILELKQRLHALPRLIKHADNTSYYECILCESNHVRMREIKHKKICLLFED